MKSKTIKRNELNTAINIYNNYKRDREQHTYTTDYKDFLNYCTLLADQYEFDFEQDNYFYKIIEMCIDTKNGNIETLLKEMLRIKVGKDNG